MPMQMGQRRGSSWQLPSGSSFIVYSGWQGNWIKGVGTHKAGATSSWVWPCSIPLSRIFQNCNQVKHMSSLGGRLQQGRRVRAIFLRASLCRACPRRPHSPESGSAASSALLISGQHQEHDKPVRAAGHKHIRHRSTIALQKPACVRMEPGFGAAPTHELTGAQAALQQVPPGPVLSCQSAAGRGQQLGSEAATATGAAGKGPRGWEEHCAPLNLDHLCHLPELQMMLGRNTYH